MQDIYKQIARKHGVSVAEVEREMQNALALAWNDPNKTESAERAQRELSPSGETPTVEDFVRAVAGHIKSK